MKKSIKVACAVIVFLFCIINISCNVLGFSGMAGIHSTNENVLTKLGGNILGPIRVGCTAAGIIAVLVAAIKYMIASPSEKASIKGQMIGLAIGGVILFGAPQILTLISKSESWW